ncbi:MAG: Crp/Fnr family transcriptional regulator [Blastocatellia bacterium]|nr:MAG: Crp/Fnr family transcriptional regulator [Blastocatellia bacterium]
MPTFEAKVDIQGTSRRVTANVRANRLVAELPEQELRIILPHLKLVQFGFDDVLYEHGSQIESVYFPLDAVVSNLVLLEDGCAIETAMTGREGIVGVSTLLGRPDARQWTRVTVGGIAAALDRRFLNDRFTDSAVMQKIVLTSYRRLITQVSQRAVCNARHSILEKLCCWLLMIHDRVGSEDLQLTQEAIATRLGSRRAGITQAATILRSMRAISYVRGLIVITDRGILEHAACECYEVFRTDFDSNPSTVGFFQN